LSSFRKLSIVSKSFYNLKKAVRSFKNVLEAVKKDFKSCKTTCRTVKKLLEALNTF